MVDWCNRLCGSMTLASPLIFQRYWAFGLYPSSWLLKNKQSKKHDVSETGSVSVLRWGKNPTLLGPLERASLNHRTIDVTNPTGYKHLRPGQVHESEQQRDPVSETSCFLICLLLISRTMDRVRKLNICESYTPSSESYSNYLSYSFTEAVTTITVQELSDTCLGEIWCLHLNVIRLSYKWQKSLCLLSEDCHSRGPKRTDRSKEKGERIWVPRL
jgi:hypothetical protein